MELISGDCPIHVARERVSKRVLRRSERDRSGGGTTGPSDSDGAEDRESPADAVRRETCGGARDHAGEHAGSPGDQVCRVSADSAHRQGCARGDATPGPSVQTVAQTEAVSPEQSVGRADVPVIKQVRQVTNPVETPQTQHIDNGVKVPAVTQRQVPPKFRLCRTRPPKIRDPRRSPVQTGHIPAPQRSRD